MKLNPDDWRPSYVAAWAAHADRRIKYRPPVDTYPMIIAHLSHVREARARTDAFAWLTLFVLLAPVVMTAVTAVLLWGMWV